MCWNRRCAGTQCAGVGVGIDVIYVSMACVLSNGAHHLLSAPCDAVVVLRRQSSACGGSKTYPAGSGSTEIMVNSYNDLGQLRSVYSSGGTNTYAADIRYDLLGRVTVWSDGSGLVHHADRDTTGANNCRISDIYTRNLKKPS